MYTTIESMIEVSKGCDERKLDSLRSPRTSMWFEDGRVALGPDLFNSGTMLVPMSDWAMRQVCDKLGPPPFKYIRQCPPDLQSVNLDHWRKLVPEDKNWLVRLDDGRVRGVLSSEYVPVSNTWVLESLLEMINEGVQGGMPYKLVHPVLDANTLQLRVVVADAKKENYAIGFYLTNGEIGNCQVKVLPMIQRTSCTNSLVFALGGFFQRHFHVSLPFLKGAIKEKIGQAIGLAASYLDKVVEAEMMAIPSIADTVAGICDTYGLNQQIHDLILVGTEGQQTIGGVANGLSFAAQRVEDVLLRERMEMMAGHLVVDPGLATGPYTGEIDVEE